MTLLPLSTIHIVTSTRSCTMSNTAEIIATVSTGVVIASQAAAAFGKPALVEKFRILSLIIDFIAGNWGKSKNRTTSAEGSKLK